MKNLKYTLCILILKSLILQAKEDSKEERVFFTVKDGQLIIVDRIDQRQLKVENINSIKSLNIAIIKSKEHKKSKKQKNSKKDQGKKSKIDRSEVSKYILKAKKLFNDGNIVKAWDIVDSLDEVDPKDYRIKTMKGSLFYTTGEYEKAIFHWNESLKLNKNQSDVRTMIKEAEKKIGNKK